MASIYDKINNATGLNNTNYGIKKSKTKTKKRKNIFNGLGNVFNVPDSYKNTPRKKTNIIPNLSQGYNPLGNIQGVLGNYFNQNQNQTQTPNPYFNPSNFAKDTQVNPYFNPSNFATPTTNTPTTNNNQNAPLSSADQQAVYNAGIQGGLSPAVSAQIAFGDNSKVRNVSSKFSQPKNTNNTQTKVVTLTRAESEGLKSRMGLQGVNVDVTGMTPEQANKTIQETRDRLSQNSNALTTTTVNPQAISGVEKVANNFKIQLNDVTNNPYQTKETINNNKKIKVDSFASSFAKNFNSLDNFNSIQNNPDFLKAIQPYLDAGGTLAQIANKIPSNVQGIQPATTTSNFLNKQNNTNNPTDVVNTIDNPDGTTTNILSDGTILTVRNIQNSDGSTTSVPVANQEIYSTMLPETKIGQEEIARLAGIPKNLIDAYFGTPEKIGILEQKANEAKAQKDLLAKKELEAEQTAREKAQLNIDKNNADVAEQRATIEKNRLKSKNYLTGFLAKIGALKTSGAAGLALVNLDEKYQAQESKLNTSLIFANRQIKINLNESINNIENKLQEDINTINSDLTLSNEKTTEKINKAIDNSNNKIYTISSSLAKELSKNKENYKKELQSNSAKYSTEFMKLIGNGLSVTDINKILTSSGIVDTSKVTSSIINKIKNSKKSSNRDFSKTELKKLEQAGINPNTQRKKALDFLFKGNVKPAYDGLTLKIDSRSFKKNFNKFNKKSKENNQPLISIKDVNYIKNEINKTGLSLKQIAQRDKIPTNIFNFLTNFLE